MQLRVLQDNLGPLLAVWAPPYWGGLGGGCYGSASNTFDDRLFLSEVSFLVLGKLESEETLLHIVDDCVGVFSYLSFSLRPKPLELQGGLSWADDDKF